MKHTEIVLQGQENEIYAADGRKELFQIEEITAHLLNSPDVTIRDLKKTETDGNSITFSSACCREPEIKVRLYRESGLTALSFDGNINGRENKDGYPIAFAPDPCIRISLTLDQDAPFEANYQHKAWWLRPAFGDRLSEIPEKTQLLIRKKKEKYEVFLALCSDEFRTDLSGSADGIVVSLSAFRNNRKHLHGTAMICGFGENPYEIIRSCVRLAMRIHQHSFMELSEKRYPEVFEGIGWCTWDSLGQNVSEAGILQKMDEFREKNLQIPCILIDDGWSDVNRERLTLRGLDADPVRFPKGLAHTVKILKEKYQVSYVGVWQAFKGYWYGIEENSEAHHKLEPYLTRYGNGEISVKPTEEAAFGFWDRWHQELRKMGIDFVKIDGQGSVPTMLHGDTPENPAIRYLYRGLEASVFLNFDGNLINCMGMAPENVWNRCRSAISRSSDDYTPTVPGSIVEHTLQNCYNNVYQGDLFTGDWDMFWTEHEEAHFSSVLRAISGGPVYISDACGHTRKEVLEKLISADGNILRCDSVARPALDCLTENALSKGEILKIYNTCKDAVYVACFTWDLSGKAVEGVLRKKDIPVMKTGSYLVYDQELRFLGRCSDEMDYIFQMGARQAKILELVPEEKIITILGMTDKFIAGAGVENTRIFQNICSVKVNCGGTFSFVSRQEVDQVFFEGRNIPYTRESDVYTVKVKDEGGVIDIILCGAERKN